MQRIYGLYPIASGCFFAVFSMLRFANLHNRSFIWLKLEINRRYYSPERIRLDTLFQAPQTLSGMTKCRCRVSM